MCVCVCVCLYVYIYGHILKYLCNPVNMLIFAFRCACSYCAVYTCISKHIHLMSLRSLLRSAASHIIVTSSTSFVLCCVIAYVWYFALRHVRVRVLQICRCPYLFDERSTFLPVQRHSRVASPSLSFFRYRQYVYVLVAFFLFLSLSFTESSAQVLRRRCAQTFENFFFLI